MKNRTIDFEVSRVSGNSYTNDSGRDGMGFGGDVFRYIRDVDVKSISAHAHGDQGVSLGRVYPQFSDTELVEGRVLSLIESSSNEARVAIEEFARGGIEDVGVRLSIIAAQLADAHELSKFDKSLSAVISFIRRATMCKASVDVDMEGLQALFCALRSIEDDPIVDLNRAAEITDELECAGWDGELGFSREFMASLDEIDLAEPVQAESSVKI